MKRYGNKSGNSGIESYQTGTDNIRIKFKTGGTYIYNYRKPGAKHVEQMKILAKKGEGLATYINQYVRDNFDSGPMPA